MPVRVSSRLRAGAVCALIGLWPAAGRAQHPSVTYPGSGGGQVQSKAAAGVRVYTPGGGQGSGSAGAGASTNASDLAAGMAYVDLVKQALQSVSAVAGVIGAHGTGGGGGGQAGASTGGIMAALSRLQAAVSAGGAQ